MKTVNAEKKISFENMSLHTLANLYLDCFKNYGSRLFYSDQDHILANNIFIYIQSRGDEQLFFQFVNKYADMR